MFVQEPDNEQIWFHKSLGFILQQINSELFYV